MGAADARRRKAAQRAGLAAPVASSGVFGTRAENQVRKGRTEARTIPDAIEIWCPGLRRGYHGVDRRNRTRRKLEMSGLSPALE